MPRMLFMHRRGAIAVLSAVMSVILLGLVAFAIDLGLIAQAHTELQRTADAAALTAAAQLPDLVAATDAGIATTAGNASASSPLVAAGDFEFGWWDRDTATFLAPPPVHLEANAVRVHVGGSEAGRHPITLFYGRMWNRKPANVSASAVAMNDRGLCGPLIGIDSLTLSGNVTTDSYRSAQGSYHAASAGQRGNLCSNGPITINGSAYIQGSVRAGRSKPVKIQNASAIVIGNVGSRVKPLELPPVIATEVAYHNDNALLGSAINGARDFELAGDHVFAIPTGIYFLNNMRLRGSAKLKITGETVIYLTGELDRTGGAEVSNDTHVPNNLRILSTGGAVKITSNEAFHGVIYAPQSEVDLAGGAELFGAVVGQNLRIHGDATAHFDESLNVKEVELPSRTTLVE